MIIIHIILRRILKLICCIGLLWACSDNRESPEIIPREAWNARDPVHPRRMEKRRRHHVPFKGICIHYSGFSCNISPHSLQAYQILHLHYPDITYHYIINKKGNVYQGRDTAYFSETPTGADEYIHLCCVSDMKFQKGIWLPEKQAESLRKLIQYLYDLYYIPDKNIFFYDSTGYEDLDFM